MSNRKWLALSGKVCRVVDMPRVKKGANSLDELAAALNISRSTVDGYAKRGMPREIDAARAWLARTQGKTAAANSDALQTQLPAEDVSCTLDELRARIAAQKRHAARCIDCAAAAVGRADAKEAKDLNALSSAAQATLIALERELRQRLLESSAYVPIEHAEKRFGGLLTEIVKALDIGEVEFAAEANPDNPGAALVAYRKRKRVICEMIASGALKE